MGFIPILLPNRGGSRKAAKNAKPGNGILFQQKPVKTLAAMQDETEKKVRNREDKNR
jgi:hypothetical protein